MPIELRLPQIADAMTTAKLAVWLKKEGDAVTSGEPIVEVETDKTTVEVEAPCTGILERILITDGTEGVPVGTLLAVIADGRVPAVTSAPSSPPADAAEAVLAHAPPAVARATTAAARERLFASPAETALTPHDPCGVLATPLAARMAAIADLDLSTIVPAAGRARINKTDVQIAIERRRPAPAAALDNPSHPEPAQAPGPSRSMSSLQASGGTRTYEATRPDNERGGATYTDHPLSPMRRITAERLRQSKQTIPHFYLQAECRVDALVDLRAYLNTRDSRLKVTVTDLIVFAAARALEKVPQANSAWMDTAVRTYDDVDIAVAVNTPKGLITPILRGCRTRTLRSLSLELKELVERARKGTLTPHEYTGGTFTISNLGMFGVTSITPIINPPHACILGVGGIEDRAVVVDRQLAVGRTMSCTLAADHRVVDGATGAELLGEIRRLIEDPMAIALQL